MRSDKLSVKINSENMEYTVCVTYLFKTFMFKSVQCKQKWYVFAECLNLSI